MRVGRRTPGSRRHPSALPCYAAPASWQRGTAVAAQRPTRARPGKRAAKRATTHEVQATPSAVPERRFVDIDPWAVLLEQLMEVPEEEPAERKRGERK